MGSQYFVERGANFKKITALFRGIKEHVGDFPRCRNLLPSGGSSDRLPFDK